MLDAITNFLSQTGFAMFGGDNWKCLIMIAIAFVLSYLAIVKQFEPLLLLPIAFGMLLTNLPGAEMFHETLFAGGHVNWQLFGGADFVNSANLIAPEGYVYTFLQSGEVLLSNATYGQNILFGEISGLSLSADAVLGTAGQLLDASKNVVAENVNVMIDMAGTVVENGKLLSNGVVLATDVQSVAAGLLDYLYLGVKLGIYPCLIFLGVGAMTDFGPLIANPKSLLLGAAAQLGVFAAFFGAVCLGFTGLEAAAIGIIGGADGPTAIFLTSKLAPHLLGAIAVAAYSYMALIPLIQPRFMKLLTTPEQRKIKMVQTRTVSKTEKIIFPIIVTLFVALLLPDTAPLIGCLMLGNLFRECGVTDRLSDTVQNALMNIVTILLSTSVGATMVGSNFLTVQTLSIVLLGVVAFVISTCGGLLGGLVMCKLTKGKVNPLIGSAGVSAVPMAARVSNLEGQKANPSNFLLMHAMGPNVAGVIGSAIAAGFLLKVFG